MGSAKLSEYVVLTSIAFVVGLVSWALPAWKYHKQTNVGAFAGALLAAGVILMSMFKWSEVALDVAGAKLEIKERDQKIADLQTNLSNAQTALTQVGEKAPDTADLASNIQEAMRKAGYTVDQSTVKAIAADSLKPLRAYLDSPEWYDTIKPPVSNKTNPDIQKKIGPISPQSGEKPSPSFEPMVLPKKTN